MVFTIKFLNLELNSQNFESLHAKIIEACNDCLVHDCNTESGFTIQVKPSDFSTKGRVELKADYNQLNTLTVEIEKEHQTAWSLSKMEELIKILQDMDSVFEAKE